MNRFTIKTLSFLFALGFYAINGCKEGNITNTTPLIEKQITFTPKTHSLDNNDNFSPDGKYLCYDTRGMVFNTNLANSKSIEKVEIATGKETVLWKPESVSGENGAPGVAAVSYHPTDNKVIFIHGPLLEEVDIRGYYDIRNRTGVMVSADGSGVVTKVDMRDTSVDGTTTRGAQRGGTHRHEYSRNGDRIGFTYDDSLIQDYDRTIGYMEASKSAPEGFNHYFSVLLKPAKKGESKPGEIEKAYGDSWVDSLGSKRAFIGRVRAKNGVDYEHSLFVAEISDAVDITSAYSGDAAHYPEPPKGIEIRRLTHSVRDSGIVRGAYSGKQIAYLSKDEKDILQVFVIPVDGSDLAESAEKRPKQVTNYPSDASFIRWHPSDKWLFSISNGKIHASYIGSSDAFGKSIVLTPDHLNREAIVVSPDGKMLAYNINLPHPTKSRIIDGELNTKYLQIFILELHDILNLSNK